MPPKGPRSSGFKKSKQAFNSIYKEPLPLVIENLEPPNDAFAFLKSSRPTSVISNPQCVGILDMPSRSVWVVNAKDTRILWTRGFFGKGSLSRSEPSWLTRRLNEMKVPTSGLTAEEVTAKRRAERAKFKSDRAEAIAAAQAEAEQRFNASLRSPTPSVSSSLGDTAPSVLRPTRPLQSTYATATASTPGDTPSQDATEQPSGDPPLNSPAKTEPIRLNVKPPDLVDEEANPESQEDMEHLQLTLPEAFFLAWALGCLRVLDPTTDTYLDSPELLSKCLEAHLPFNPPDLARRPDNPFLVNYVIYHHYRSLGWVVRGGIKFCADYLLYKRGPVFHHAEFALVVCPVYEDPDDQTSSPFGLTNSQPMDWTWFSTINRVNSQVKKTLILTYVTIPSAKRMANTSVSLDSPECLSLYSVREVVIRRFIPARMRD